ncbi:hypothetical protein Bca52824_027771 [Brassica carinata]|uniref:Cleavage and polyadenylation specificity factor subunit 2 n=1 Tax=Brassica carinata TaxID=52824 RepID=A0A8X7VB51_BRACI|nr:hypothetical protein Bca52824_027771 [Brassica carinata]
MVSSDDSFVLVTEYQKSNIKKYWIKGPKAGSSEDFTNSVSEPTDHDSGGWVMKLQLRRMRGLRRSLRVASTVDAVLLSHPDILHLGALPYAMKQLGLSAPIYATEPVHRLGLLTITIDYVKSFLEWMSTPFQSPLRLHVIMPLLRHVTLLINETDLDNAPPGPKVG